MSALRPSARPDGRPRRAALVVGLFSLALTFCFGGGSVVLRAQPPDEIGPEPQCAPTLALWPRRQELAEFLVLAHCDDACGNPSSHSVSEVLIR